jgi:ferredoxin
VLDPLFRKDVEDPYYSRRREALVLIGHACAEPTNRCFCPSVGGSPTGHEGLDILFTDIDGSYYVEALTDRGAALITGSKGLFSKATAQQGQAREKAAEAARRKIRRSVDLTMMHEMLPKSFNDSLWQDVGNACIGCGICTYNCPTCHCFDIQDEGTQASGRRLRVWDACMYSEFTVHASGENPRKNRGDRIRNRMLHKFSYYPVNFGQIGCVGCGRCIELCPVNEDLIDILTRVREAINE